MILLFGLVILTSASNGISSDGTLYIKKQLMWFVCRPDIGSIFIRFDYTQLGKYSSYLYGMSVFILVLVLVFGQEIRGTTGWISIGPLPAAQPANLPKFC
jgi:rod shape determining protein RodA